MPKLARLFILIPLLIFLFWLIRDIKLKRDIKGVAENVCACIGEVKTVRDQTINKNRALINADSIRSSNSTQSNKQKMGLKLLQTSKELALQKIKKVAEDDSQIASIINIIHQFYANDFKKIAQKAELNLSHFEVVSLFGDDLISKICIQRTEQTFFMEHPIKVRIHRPKSLEMLIELLFSDDIDSRLKNKIAETC